MKITDAMVERAAKAYQDYQYNVDPLGPQPYERWPAMRAALVAALDCFEEQQRTAQLNAT